MHTRFTATTLAAAALAVAATPALAGTVIQRVAYDDLQLTTSKGQAELQRRVNDAVWRVCLYNQRGSLRSAEQQATCYRDTRKTVAIQVAELLSERQLGG